MSSNNQITLSELARLKALAAEANAAYDAARKAYKRTQKCNAQNVTASSKSTRPATSTNTHTAVGTVLLAT